MVNIGGRESPLFDLFGGKVLGKTSSLTSSTHQGTSKKEVLARKCL